MIVSHPLVSVVICTYGRPNDLKDSIQSILNQDFEDYEIVVVVPFHDEKSISLLKTFSNIKIVIQKTGKGLSVARNLGIAACDGEYVAFIDDDAIAEPKWLSNLVRCYTDDKIGAVGGLVLGTTGWVQFKNGCVSKLGEIKIDEPFSREEYNSENSFWINQMMGTNSSFRRDLLIKLGGFDTNYRYYFDETELCIRVIKNGFKIVHANDAIVVHKFSDGINRSGYWNNNWSQILKNTMIFAISNFWSKSTFKTRMKMLYRPIVLRFYESYRAKKSKQIGYYMLARIYLRLISGYMHAIQQILFMKQNKTNWIPHQETIEIIKTDGNNTGLLKICLVSQQYPPGEIGGNGRHTHILARKLAEKGHTVHVITARNGNEFVDNVHIHGVMPRTNFLKNYEQLSIVKKNLEHGFAVQKKIQEIHNRFGLDIVEFVLWDSEGFVFSLNKNIPYVVRAVTPIFKVAEIHGWNFDKDLLACMEMEKRFLDNADGIITISDNIKRTVSEQYHLDYKDWYFGPIGIPTNHSDFSSSEAKTILYVGRLEQRKGVDTIVKSIPAVVKKHPHVKFILAGVDTIQNSKSYKKYLTSLIDKKYFDSVQFLGYVDDTKLQELYQKCTIFVAPSIYESFGIIFLEAMKAGKPVIGTNAGGIPEIVKDKETGLLINPGNVDDLSSKIIYLLDNAEMRKKMGEKGQKRLTELFSDERFVQDSIKIYKEVIKKTKKLL